MTIILWAKKKKNMRAAEASFWFCSIKYPGGNCYSSTQWDDLHLKQSMQKLIYIKTNSTELLRQGLRDQVEDAGFINGLNFVFYRSTSLSFTERRTFIMKIYHHRLKYRYHSTHWYHVMRLKEYQQLGFSSYFDIILHYLLPEQNIQGVFKHF